MWEIWVHYLLTKALKCCPKSNKLPNLVTLLGTETVCWKIKKTHFKMILL